MSPAYQKIFIGLIIVSTVLTLFFWFIKRKVKVNLYSRFWNGLYSFSLTNASVGLVIWFFNYEMVPFLSARFWFLIWGIEIVVWAVFLMKVLTRIPKIKEQVEKEKEFKKYIP